jgi:hypothetical protein
MKLQSKSLHYSAAFFAVSCLLGAASASAAPQIGTGGTVGSGAPSVGQAAIIVPAPVPTRPDVPVVVFRASESIIRPTADSPGTPALKDPGAPSKTFSLGGGTGGTGGTGGVDVPDVIGNDGFGNTGQPPFNPETFGNTGGGLGELAPAAGGNATGGSDMAYIGCVNDALNDQNPQNDPYEKCRNIQ